VEHIEKSTCELRHKELNDKIGNCERRLNAHSEKIDKLTEDNTAFKVELKHLCQSIKSLTTTLWWFIGIIIGGICTFFFTALQKGVIK